MRLPIPWQLPELTGDELAYEIVKSIKALLDLEQKCFIALGYLLWKAKTAWETFSEDFKNSYGGTFMAFAKEVTGKDEVTILNYINVFSTWFTGRYQLPEGIKPEEVPVSKLLLCTARLKRGEMREQDWDALANPQLTYRQLKRQLLSGFTRTETRGRRPGFRYFLDSRGILWAERYDGERAAIGVLYSTVEDWRQKAIEQVKRRLEIKSLGGGNGTGN